MVSPVKLSFDSDSLACCSSSSVVTVSLVIFSSVVLSVSLVSLVSSDLADLSSVSDSCPLSFPEVLTCPPLA
jgi:hypothetical protein